jgi:integrase
MNCSAVTQTLLREFFEETFRPLFLRGKSPRTIDLYRGTLKSFERFLARPPTLADLNDTTVNRFLCWFRELPRSPYSVNKEHANLTALWRFACRKKFLDVWPDVPRDPEPVAVPLAWMPHELDKLFKSLDTMPGAVGQVLACHWWRALLLLCWDTGERVTALLRLQWTDLDLESGWMIVPATNRKGGKSEEAYRLHPDTVAALRAIQLPPRSEVFPWPYAETYLWNRFGKVLRRAGLPDNRKSKFHRIRKSVGSYVKAAGGDASAALRHKDSRVTDSYIDPRVAAPAQAVDYLFRPGGTAG